MSQLPVSGFLQYGAIGILALVAIIAAWALYRRTEKAFEKEVERGDRLEKQLLALNQLVADKLAGELVRATEAIRDVVELVRSRRRW